jgi:hypothetical protein
VRYVLDKPFGGVEVLPWVSSGETDERAAYEWAAKNGPKLPKVKRDLGEITPFEEWAKGWWEPDHYYVTRQSARGYSLTPTYLDQCRSLLKHHIIPHFCKLPRSGLRKPEELPIYLS